jgi:hypothetical protein
MTSQKRDTRLECFIMYYVNNGRLTYIRLGPSVIRGRLMIILVSRLNFIVWMVLIPNNIVGNFFEVI